MRTKLVVDSHCFLFYRSQSTHSVLPSPSLFTSLSSPPPSLPPFCECGVCMYTFLSTYKNGYNSWRFLAELVFPFVSCSLLRMCFIDLSKVADLYVLYLLQNLRFYLSLPFILNCLEQAFQHTHFKLHVDKLFDLYGAWILCLGKPPLAN